MVVNSTTCERCGWSVGIGEVVCPRCGADAAQQVRRDAAMLASSENARSGASPAVDGGLHPALATAMEAAVRCTPPRSPVTTRYSRIRQTSRACSQEAVMGSIRAGSPHKNTWPAVCPGCNPVMGWASLTSGSPLKAGAASPRYRCSATRGVFPTHLKFSPQHPTRELCRHRWPRLSADGGRAKGGPPSLRSRSG